MAAAQHSPLNQKRNMYHMAGAIGEKTCTWCYLIVVALGWVVFPPENQSYHFFPRLLMNSKKPFVFFQAIFHKPRPTFPVSIYGGRNWEDQTHSKPSKIPGEPLVRHQ